MDNFSSSDEAFAADALFDAYRRQAGAVRACWVLVQVLVQRLVQLFLSTRRHCVALLAARPPFLP